MQVVKAPDSKLRVVTKNVKKINPALLSILKDMVKLTKTFKDPEGVGLASTQVGLTERYFVAKHIPLGKDRKDLKGDYEFIKVINPKMISLSKKTKTYFEGCLSTPDIWGEVKRHLSIKVSYMDELGNQFTKTLTGVSAWIFQHEIDHLDGILFQDRVLQQKGQFFRFTGKDRAGKDNFEEINLP